MNETVYSFLAFSHGRHALLSVAQPALGALLAAQGFPDRRTTILGAMAAGAGMLCVYASNDLFDLPTDRVEAGLLAALDTGDRTDKEAIRHPLARGALPLWFAVSWIAGTGLAAFALATKLRRGCGLMFAACVGLEALYSSLRRRTWLKTLPGGVTVGLGALSGWYAVRGLDADAFRFFLLVTMWEIFGRNISNDLADLSLDAPIGIRTLPTTYGPDWSARVCLGGSVAMIPVAALQKGPLSLRLAMAALVAGTTTLPAFRLLHNPTERESQTYFSRASLFPPLAFLAVSALLLGRRHDKRYKAPHAGGANQRP